MCHSINIDLSCAIFSHYTLFKTDIRGFLKDLYFLEVDKQAQGDREYGTHYNFFLQRYFFGRNILVKMKSRETWLLAAKSCARCGKQKIKALSETPVTEIEEVTCPSAGPSP